MLAVDRESIGSSIHPFHTALKHPSGPSTYAVIQEGALAS
jgi:hypothetical protein